jgi:hypothetical protein
METIFENETFMNTFSNVKYYKDEILDVMKKMKEQDQDLSIDNFICILHKIIDPSISYINHSMLQYMYSIEQWNQYNYNNNTFHLMIETNNLTY